MSTRRSAGRLTLRLARAQLVEDDRRGKAVGNLSDRGLEIADRGSCPGAELAVGLADVVAAVHQQLLQLQPLVAREHALVTRPSLRERLPAAQPVGKMADRERIGFG